MTKPTGTSGQGKCGGCALKAHVLIRGDLSDVAVRSRAVANQPGHRNRSANDAGLPELLLWTKNNGNQQRLTRIHAHGDFPYLAC
jgi:hypothetical protein